MILQDAVHPSLTRSQPGERAALLQGAFLGRQHLSYQKGWFPKSFLYISSMDCQDIWSPESSKHLFPGGWKKYIIYLSQSPEVFSPSAEMKSSLAYFPISFSLCK